MEILETSRPPRIALLASGASVHTLRWAGALADAAWDVHLISVHPCAASLDPRVRVHRPALRGLGYFAAGISVRRLVRRLRPDLVHAHYASGYGTLLTIADCHPAVISVWGKDVYEFPDRSWLHRSLLRRNLASADVILSTSRVMAKRTHEFTEKPIHVTPFGVDLARFVSSVRPAVLGDPIVIGAVKALEEKYGIEYLLAAFRRLKNRLAGMRLRLLIVGGGSLAASLQQSAGRLGISADTTFTGAVAHERVPELLKKMDIFVAPSIDHSESFGVAAVEASACGLPVVVSRVGGLAEVVDDGVTGLLVEPRSEQQLAAGLERLALNPALRRKMGNAGRERVARLYDWNANVRQMLSIYEGLAAAKSARNRREKGLGSCPEALS